MGFRPVPHLTVLLLATSLFGLSGDERSASAADIDTGALQGTVLWNGAPVDARLANSPCALQVQAVPAGGSNPITPAGSYSFPVLQPGTYNLRVFAQDQIASGPSATVSADATTTQDIDVTSALGLLTGVVTVGGSPVANPYLDVNHAGFCQVGGSDGSFAFLLPPGNYGAAVRSAQNQCPVGIFQFTVPAVGQTTTLGAVAAQPPSSCQDATIQGTVLFNGAPYQSLGLDCDNLSVYDDSFSFGSFVAADGTYSGTLSSYSNGQVLLHLGSIVSRTVWVVSSVTTTADFDVTASAGVPTGAVTIDGAPLVDGRVFVSLGCSYTDAAGNFKLLVPGGNYTATVRQADNSLIGSFNFSITNGQSDYIDVDGTATTSGNNVVVSLQGGLASTGGIELTYSTVASDGFSLVAASPTGPPPPAELDVLGVNNDALFYDINASAIFSGSVNICTKYNDAQVTGPEANVKLMRHDGSVFVDITTSVDIATNVVCGTSSSLSPFAVMEVADFDGDGMPNNLDTDDDNDGFSDAIELYVGTNRWAVCGTAAWPPDITDDGYVDTGDLGRVTGEFGNAVPPAPARRNIAPDPPDGYIDTGDIGRLTGLFGRSCL